MVMVMVISIDRKLEDFALKRLITSGFSKTIWFQPLNGSRGSRTCIIVKFFLMVYIVFYNYDNKITVMQKTLLPGGFGSYFNIIQK